MWTLRRYNGDADRPAWDEFVGASRNATFLFRRQYMDYHADRFNDCSLMAFRNGKLAALLPANITGTRLCSHQGLTYGGWLLPSSGLDCGEIIELWKEWLRWCLNNGIAEILYKPLPDIYAKTPSEEDRYLLFLSGSSLVRADLSSAINLSRNPGLNKLQRRHLAHAPADLKITRVGAQMNPESIGLFHKMLSDCLKERHDTAPVHSLSELRMLMERFPDNIEIWLADLSGAPQAGVCLYKTDTCAHAQYIATTSAGRDMNLLTPLFYKMIEEATAEGRQFFDFGISTEESGKILNRGLNRQKSSYGATGVIYTHHLISVSAASESLRI